MPIVTIIATDGTVTTYEDWAHWEGCTVVEIVDTAEIGATHFRETTEPDVLCVDYDPALVTFDDLPGRTVVRTHRPDLIAPCQRIVDFLREHPAELIEELSWRDGRHTRTYRFREFATREFEADYEFRLRSWAEVATA